MGMMTRHATGPAQAFSWKRDLALTLLMPGLLFVFSYWQISDHLRLRVEQRKLVNFLQDDICMTLAGIVNSQPRFGAIVLKDQVVEKINRMFEADEYSSLIGVALYNARQEMLVAANRPQLPDQWHERPAEAGADHTVVVLDYQELAAIANLGGAEPVLGDYDVITDLMSRIYGATRGQTGPLPANHAEQMAAQVRELLAAETMKAKTLHRVALVLDLGLFRQAVRKDLRLRSLSIFLCLIAVLVFLRSLFSLRQSLELRIKLTEEQDKIAHYQEMHLAAAGLAHEVRNPLNLVRGITQSLAEAEGLPREVAEQAGMIAEEADRINTRFNSFLAYTNQREAKPARIDGRQIIQEVIDLLAIDVEEKGVRIETDLPSGSILADGEIFRQIVFNLLHNAIKAVNKGGRIQVRAGRLGRSKLWLEVADDGPGVPEAAREDVFKPYFTLDQKGTGLGLAIVRQLAFKHGWKVSCVAGQGPGAVFRIEGIELA